MTDCTDSRLSAAVRAVGVIGPGLPDWPSAVAVLRGQQAYAPAALEVPPPAALPPPERRRVGAPVRLALAAAAQALGASGRAATDLATVFAASGGDGAICHEICSALAAHERHLSPTAFHNSVHNAAAGYWSIAMHATAPSTALSAYDGSFAAGLLEALAQVSARAAPVLLVSYDTAYPEPLHSKRPILAPFACALLLEPGRASGCAAWISATLACAPADTLAGPLETLRRGTPSARALPLLQRIARAEGAHVVLEYLPDLPLAVEVTPCP